MARAGGGGGRSSGGGRSFGGGHSSSRSGGGHRVGSSGGGSRARGGGFSGGSSRGPGMPPPRHHGGPGMPPPPRRYRRYYGGGYGGRRSSGGVGVAVVIILLVVLCVFYGVRNTGYYGSSYSSGNQVSTIERQKLESGNAYINDCVIDEIGWFENESKTESQLKEFWEETGIQPYIILKDYDASLTTDSQKEQWTTDYYDANFDTENIFLYVYFAEEDVDNDVGYMCYANGYQTSSVMDSEAIEIFWNNIDKYWYTDMSTDDLFVEAFNDTADTIMHVSTTGKDVAKWAIIAVVVVAVGVVIVTVINKKNQRAKEEAAEDERILNTPMEELTEDELTNKYKE